MTRTRPKDSFLSYQSHLGNALTKKLSSWVVSMSRFFRGYLKTITGENSKHL